MTKVCLVKAMVFSSSHVWMWEVDHKESWVLKNWWFWTVVLEKTLESPLDFKEIKPVNPKGNQSWLFIGRTNAEAESPILWMFWCKELTHWKRPESWERLKAGGEGDDRGWDGWMASLNRWTWVWASSGSWWWTGRPGLLQSMGSQTVRRDWATELIRVNHVPKPGLQDILFNKVIMSVPVKGHQPWWKCMLYELELTVRDAVMDSWKWWGW